MSEKLLQPLLEIPSEEERKLRNKVLEEMKQIARGENPLPQEEWDLIWVLSGPPVDVAERFEENGKEVFFNLNDEIAAKDVAKKINESRERLETGIKVSKEVVAKRLNKKVEGLTAEDIKNSAPDIYWNSTDWGNDNLRDRIKEGFLDRYSFPVEKIIISPNLGIQHTGHQFERVEEDVVKGRRKIVIVSDIYHLPRVKRYLHKFRSIINQENAILYPSDQKRVPIDKALGEIKKIYSYIQKGILEEEK